ncbi:LysR family transcriptional regulator [Rhodoblastus sphagnicola]|uniref:LysR family transcriptional regulator n=1 Tax=Rhodoblastus sphagnicola TaxID=333368 RepID=A0A2S6MVI3_9HYPH|nr:LysR family transcriptional regulator [Rhodoblastus sphagnicola]MBB4197535.1 DNA-binding transcriptional LysR family regulator [Rhodoblastus sphagnicola]PPQ26371.1 LysR family transcriptional regulator [Rhodoblastus sphagnicola]
MHDGFSLDQIRTFIAAAEEGSFSAAARKLGRAQSAVSDLIKRLEAQTGVTLFDRSTRSPTLTPEGKLLLADAHILGAAANKLNFRAHGMKKGVEPELCAVMDVYYPVQAMAEAAGDFREKFPVTPLRLYVEVLGGALQPVLDGRASFAVVGGPTPIPCDCAGEPLQSVEIVMVAAASHPLARIEGPISRENLADHVQLVLTERASTLGRDSSGREYGVLSPATWRLADLYAKHAFLLSGLGWGSMPRHAVQREIDEGRLKVLTLRDAPVTGYSVAMTAAYRAASPPGPAGRWLIERLRADLPRVRSF